MSESKYKLSWNEKALSDRKSVFSRLVTRNPNYALRVEDELKMASERIESNPFIGVRVPERTERRLILTSVPYIIFYGVKDSEITIYRIKHQKSMPPNFR